MAPAIPLLPPRDAKRIIEICPDIMLEALPTRDLIAAEPKIQLLHLPKREAIEVDPRVVHAVEGGVEIEFGVLRALEEGRVGEGGEGEGAEGERATGQDANRVVGGGEEGCDEVSV